MFYCAENSRNCINLITNQVNSQIMGALHFFIELDALKEQVSEDTFGHTILDDPDFPGQDTFRITSSFELTRERAKAYAMFSGLAILVDVDGHDDLVNLILTPFLLPPPIDFSPYAKYVIYRGLAKSSFMKDGSILKENDQNASELIKYIWTTHRKSKNTQPEPDLISYLSYYPGRNFPNINDGTVINDMFINKDSTLIPISKGLCLGHFLYKNNRKIGIDIILGEYIGFSVINYKMTRELAFKVRALAGNQRPTASGLPVPNNPLSSLYTRETILNFIDPAVFINLHHNEEVDYKDSNSAGVCKGALVFDNLLKKFASKNNLYIDIRNQNNKSLNFYQDFVDINPPHSNLNLKIAESNLGQVFFYENYWPLLIIKPEDRNIDSLTPDTKFTKIKLSVYKKNNKNILLYADFAYLDSPKFISNDNGLSLKKSIDTTDKFIMDESEETGWSKEYTFLIPNLKESIRPSKWWGAWMIKLFVLRLDLDMEASLPNTVVKSLSHIDNIWGPVNPSALGFFQYPQTLSNEKRSFWALGYEKKFILRKDHQPQIVHTGAALSAKTVTLYALNPGGNILFSVAQGYLGTNATDLSREKIGFLGTQSSRRQEFWEALQKRFDQQVNKLKLSNHQEIPTQYAEDNGYFNNRVDFIGSEYKNLFFSITMTDGEYKKLQTISGGLDFEIHSPYLALSHRATETSEDNSRSMRIIHTYVGYDVGVVGLDTSGKEKRIPASPVIKAYTIDEISFFTAQTGEGVDGTVYAVSENNIFDTLKLVEVVQKLEKIYFKDYNGFKADTNDLLVTRIRNHYYGLLDKDTYINQQVFNESIPYTRIRSYESDSRILKARAIDRTYNTREDLETIKNDIAPYLLSHQIPFKQGNEKFILDNPSPYITHKGYLPSERFQDVVIDLGHIFYGLDGLIHNPEPDAYNRLGPSRLFGNFGIRLVNDLTGYVADVFIAAADIRYQKNENQTKAQTIKTPLEIKIDNYDSSAPITDLYSDVDAFGVYQSWKYYQILRSGNEFGLSEVLDYYYHSDTWRNIPRNKWVDRLQVRTHARDDQYTTMNQLNPVLASYKLRWLNFCFHKDQRYVEYENGQFVWKADDWFHHSIEGNTMFMGLRERAENFAHFWLQKNYTNTILEKIWDYPEWIRGDFYFRSLKRSTLDKPILFERTDLRFHRNRYLPQVIRDEVGIFTNSSELEACMRYFLDFVKLKFEEEKLINNY